MDVETLVRSSGILLHPTSLPGPHGVGDLGEQAFAFLDFLARARQHLWQVLPLGPVGGGNSPYDARSSFAGSPLLVAPEPLVEAGLLERQRLESLPPLPQGAVDYAAAAERKGALLRDAFEAFEARPEHPLRGEFERFVAEQAYWLEDFALYQALREATGGRPWWEWEPALVLREPDALAQARQRLAREVAYHRFVQFLFERQWRAVRAAAAERGIRIVGDLPIYVAHDSADVWGNQRLFTLDPEGRCVVVSGVPPDLFSETGQLWGNPCYRWDVLAEEGYGWWINRFRRSFELVDILRVDHFRAFQAGWQVPAGAETAATGRWVPGPGVDLFRAVAARLGPLPLLVEDLGIITDDVHALREQLGYPGMKILQFAFGGGSDNPYLPHNYQENFVVYTGTHDNDTTLGWFQSCGERERRHVLEYLGTDERDIVWKLIRLAFGSVARLALVPLQDVLELGSEARMNLPGTSERNWRWRYQPGALTDDRAARLARLTTLYGRDAAPSGR